MFLEISQNPLENTCTRVSCLIKLQAWGSQLYLKKDSSTCVFLWILWNFLMFSGGVERHQWGRLLVTLRTFNLRSMTRGFVSIERDMWGRLLNVSHMFNLRPASREKINNQKHQINFHYQTYSDILLWSRRCTKNEVFH